MRIRDSGQADPTAFPSEQEPVEDEGGARTAAAREPGLPEAAAAALAAGRATRKSSGPEGKEPLLGPVHARRIERLFAAASPAVARALAAHLDRVGGKDATIGRALYLKAAQARSDDLLSGKAEDRKIAIATLAEFARRLDGMKAGDLLARATVSDLDSRVSTVDFDNEAWDLRQGVVHERGVGTDTRTDNDGLFQRFDSSCGPATLQIALCEEDPVRAFAVHDVGIASMEPTDLVSRFQAEALEKYKGVAISRRAQENKARLGNGLGKLKSRGDVEAKDAAALKAHAERKGPLTAGARRALEALRDYVDGFPTDEELAEIRAARLPRKGEGLAFEEFQKVLTKFLTPVTGVVYKRVGPEENGFAPGQTWRWLDEVDATLKRGIDVPFGTADPPHWMLLCAVEGRAPERRYLVTDPWAGRTAWVPEKKLVNGDFIDDLDLGPSEPGKGYIDSFYLPEEVAK